MAIRRMFSLQVVDTDKFTEMPISARLLYYEMGMRADDDGFVASPKKIIRSVGCSEDDLKLLIAKGFIIPFESGVVVIKHWKMNNYLRSDRYKKTIYQEEAKSLTLTDDVYHTDIPCISSVYQTDTKGLPSVSVGKDRLGKDRVIIYSSSVSADRQSPFDYQSVVDCFNSVCISLPKVQKMTDKRRKAIRSAKKQLGEQTFAELFDKVEQSDFLTGRSGAWSGCGFDWVLKPANLTKIIEGNYNRSTEKNSNIQETIYEEGW